MLGLSTCLLPIYGCRDGERHWRLSGRQCARPWQGQEAFATDDQDPRCFPWSAFAPGRGKPLSLPSSLAPSLAPSLSLPFLNRLFHPGGKRGVFLRRWYAPVCRVMCLG
ncbi:hypothetical protein GE21DRAFT_1133353 [Neurospora crassa]|nr:hypothetical protein B14D6.700 [imported] - Neurospora crassa [Neurospora crassa]KHE81961.1 hypothetical protein GE21DRAFT_1133353 [Neurospora crassa]